MTEIDWGVITKLGGGGLGAALLYLIYLVGSRMVAAIDRVAAKVDDHTTKDVESHADMREAIVRLDAKVDASFDWHERSDVGPAPVAPEPSPREKSRSNPYGVPIVATTEYSHGRRGTKGGGG